MTTSSRVLKVLSRVLATAAVIIWLGFIAQTLQFDASRPTQPKTDRVYCLNNHGHVVYLTAEEQHWLDFLERMAVSLFLLGFVLDSIRREPQFYRETWRSVLATLCGLTTPANWVAFLRKVPGIAQQWNRSMVDTIRSSLVFDRSRDTVSFYTTKNISECQNMVRSVGYSAFGTVLDSFDGYSFRLHAKRNYRNSFAPFFYGTLVQQGAGTKLEGHFTMHPFIKLFLACWFTGVLFFGGLAVELSRTHALSGNFNGDSSSYAGAIVCVVLFLFGVILVRFGSRMGREEKTLIMGWLQRSFTDTTKKPSAE